MHTTSWLLYLYGPGEFGGFGLKTAVRVVSRFGPQNRREYLGLARGAIRACVEAKQHYEGLWPSDALKTILPSGHLLNVEAFLE